MKRSGSVFATAALAAILPAQANAAATCLTEREVANIAVYAVPALVQGVRGKCAARLPKGGFLTAKGDAFAARYAALQGETWPMAKAGIMKFVGGEAAGAKSGSSIAMIAQLPDEAIRPLVDGLIAQRVGEAVAIDDCGNIERGIQLASVMGPRDSGAIIAFVLAMTKPKNPPICPAQSPSTAP